MVNKSISFFGLLLAVLVIVVLQFCRTPPSSEHLPVVLRSGDTLFHYTTDAWGAIVRGDTTQSKIRLLFTGHDFADGTDSILHLLQQYHIKGYFFFTGDFIRNFPTEVQAVVNGGHYVGCHSDHHLLYASWEKRDSLLINQASWQADLDSNYAALLPFGIHKASNSVFMAPYEWYNQAIADWCHAEGLTLINFTPGLITQADYTVPLDKNYRSSVEIVGRTLQQAQNGGLNGAFMLIHIGSSPARTNKLYWNLGTMIEELQRMGYRF